MLAYTVYPCHDVIHAGSLTAECVPISPLNRLIYSHQSLNIAVLGLRYLIRRNLHNRSSIHPTCIKIIVYSGTQHDRSSHQAGVIHVRSIRVDRWWEEAENEDYDAVPYGESVEKYSPDARYLEGTPH